MKCFDKCSACGGDFPKEAKQRGIIQDVKPPLDRLMESGIYMSGAAVHF